jgi:hypothetical protein
MLFAIRQLRLLFRRVGDTGADRPNAVEPIMPDDAASDYSTRRDRFLSM